MEIAVHDIVDEGIENQLGSAESQKLGSFVDGVEKRVEEKIDTLRGVYGDQVEGLAGKAMSEVRSYRETQLALFDPNFNVKHTEQKGAAAWNEKGGDNSIAMGHGAMERVKDEGYWRRVAKHETVHQQEQAVEYNRGSISYPGDENLEVNPTLVEWHAITKANQPDSDLTPDYQNHKRRGDALVSFLGGSDRLIAALKTGDMQALQDYIEEKLAAQRKPLTEEADAHDPAYAVAA